MYWCYYLYAMRPQIYNSPLRLDTGSDNTMYSEQISTLHAQLIKLLIGSTGFFLQSSELAYDLTYESARGQGSPRVDQFRPSHTGPKTPFICYTFNKFIAIIWHRYTQHTCNSRTRRISAKHAPNRDYHFSFVEWTCLVSSAPVPSFSWCWPNKVFWVCFLWQHRFFRNPASQCVALFNQNALSTLVLACRSDSNGLREENIFRFSIEHS